jgi:hypothetical protein
MDLRGSREPSIAPARAALALVGLEQDAGAGQHPGWGDAPTDQCPHLGTLGFCQFHGMRGLQTKRLACPPAHSRSRDHSAIES